MVFTAVNSLPVDSSGCCPRLMRRAGARARGGHRPASRYKLICTAKYGLTPCERSSNSPRSPVSRSRNSALSLIL
jgi:hypothetical protein